jgi:hypothetical protein
MATGVGSLIPSEWRSNMIVDHLRRLAGLRRGSLVLLSAVVVVLGAAGPAMAEAKDFEVFKQCPTKNPELTFCFFGETTSGEFVIGNSTVPINKTVIFQGGSILNETTGEETFVGAENGETLSKTPLTVPGGLTGIIASESLPKFLQEIINKLTSEGLAGVTATAELVANPGISRANLLSTEGVAVQFPLRVHLENTFLGNACYIGSKSSPITLELTTGTTNPPKPNKPITGAIGKFEFKDEFQLVIIRGNKLVDNAFSAPGASGCGGLLSILIDPAIDLKLALPSASGHNTAILEGSLQNATASAVKEAGF